MKLYKYVIALEVVEYFAYSMFFSILLYSVLNKHYQLSISEAALHTSAIVSLLYCFIYLGGFAGDNLLGNKLALIIGICLISFGYLSLSIIGILEFNNIYLLFGSLSFICIGTGAFKSNSSKVFADFVNDDYSLDIKFLYFLVFINLGAFIGSFIGPIIKTQLGWSAVVIACFCTTSISWIIILQSFSRENIDFKFSLERRKLYLSIVGLIVTLIIVTIIISFPAIAVLFQTLAIFVAFIYVGKQVYGSKLNKNMVFSIVLILLALTINFIFVQRTISVNIFTILFTDHRILGYKIPPESFQSFDAMWIILLVPLCIFFLKKNNKPLLEKFFRNIVLGGVFCIFGYLLLFVLTFTGKDQLISSNWIVLYQLLMAMTEICINTTGLSIICSFMPNRVRATSIGVWFILLSYGHLLGGVMAKNMLDHQSSSQVKGVMINYSYVFGSISLFGMVILCLAYIFKMKYLVHKN